MTEYGWKDFHWDKDKDLIFNNKAVASLVPCKEYPKHWHIKFIWRDKPTPEFFNLINAKENARRICRIRATNGILEAQENAVQPRTEV